MNVARFAIRNARAIILGVVLLTGAGIYSMTALPSGIYPEVEFPRIVMVAHAGDLAPRMMQLAVTRPLEEAARTATSRTTNTTSSKCSLHGGHARVCSNC